MSSVEINARVMKTDASGVDELMYEKTDVSVDEIGVPVECVQCVQSSVCIQTAGQPGIAKLVPVLEKHHLFKWQERR